MAANKKRAFDGLYAQLEEVNNHVVLFAAKGEPSVIFEMTNPVQQLCTDAEQYLRFQDVLSNIVQTPCRNRMSSANSPITTRCRRMRNF